MKSLRCKWVNGEVVKRLPEIGGGDAGMAVRTVVEVKRLPEIGGGDAGMACGQLRE